MPRLDRDSVEWRAIEGEVVALDLRDSSYLAINKAGALLWPMLVDGATDDDLVQKLLDTYAIERQTAEQDVRAFLRMLDDKGLLRHD